MEKTYENAELTTEVNVLAQSTFENWGIFGLRLELIKDDSKVLQATLTMEGKDGLMAFANLNHGIGITTTNSDINFVAIDIASENIQAIDALELAIENGDNEKVKDLLCRVREANQNIINNLEPYSVD